MSTIDNMPRVKKALDNLREVLETERRDRIEFLRSCIGTWRADIARAEKLPEQIARSEAEIAELETVCLPLSVTTLLGGAVRNCPLCLLPVMTSELNFHDGVVACRTCRLNAEEYNKARDVKAHVGIDQSSASKTKGGGEVKTKLSVIQEVTTDGLYCGESKQELCPKYVPGGMCGQFDFIDLRSDEDGWLRADACIKAEERALETVA